MRRKRTLKEFSRKHIHIILCTLSVGFILCGLVMLIQDFYNSTYASDTSAATVQEASFSNANVLYLSSYSRSFTTVPDQERGIQKVFDQYPGITLTEEFMDTRNYPAEGNLQNVYESLLYKYRNKDAFDAIILADDAALKFGLRYRDDLFKGSPMVFMCINDFDRARSAMNYHDVTGNIEGFDLKGTIEVAAKLLPNADTVVAIYDDTDSGLGDFKRMKEIEADFPNYSFQYINTSMLYTDELVDQLECIGKNSIVLYLDAFENADGTIYDMETSAKFIAQHCPVPVFRASIGGLGLGLAGGHYFDYEAAGETAARTVIDILNGASADDMPVNYENISHYAFDFDVLRKHGLNTAVLPKETEFINEPLSYFRRYKAIILPSAYIMSGLFLWLIVLEISNEEKRRKTRELTYSKNKLQYMYEHDTMTQLPNRGHADTHMQEMLQEGGTHTLMLIDVDNFKTLNDTFGHGAGDYVLKEMARRLRLVAVKYQGFVSRYGGDEFAILFANEISQESGEMLSYLRNILNEPYIYEEQHLTVTCSIGVTASNGKDSLVNELFSEADKALTEAKNRGKHTAVFYDATMHERILEEDNIVQTLHDACDHDGFRIVYQPQISTKTGKVIGYEALVRLKSGAYYPDRFIAPAEKYGMIIKIGRIVTEKVIHQMAVWRAQGVELQKVSINYSAKQLQDEEYVLYLKSLLQKENIAPDLIEIEVTESLYMEYKEQTNTLFRQLRELGIGLALDDFGTGYSSLNYLTFIPADRIKLDKKMTDTYLQQGKTNIIKNIVNIAHDLNMTLCIEGVENRAQYDLATALGCDDVQGYFFSRPMDGNAVPYYRVEFLDS
ncbi:MAG: EAL domain-containing protein [Lachnospiraceae bacterium]|nr:EAL domain-containing protein [Lachnospiraceae bacterium]